MEESLKIAAKELRNADHYVTMAIFAEKYHSAMETIAKVLIALVIILFVCVGLVANGLAAKGILIVGGLLFIIPAIVTLGIDQYFYYKYGNVKLAKSFADNAHIVFMNLSRYMLP